MPGDVLYRRHAFEDRRPGDIVKVPRGHLWVEGDNQHNSNDSNAFGAVPAGLVEARVDLKLWPLSEAGIVRRQEPPPGRIVRRGTP